MTLYIKTIGNGYPLVFFHGWGFDHQVWSEVAESLQRYFSIYLVDLPGYGRSSSQTWPEFKEELLQRLPFRFALVAWSLGGLYALKLSGETNQVSHLIAVASSPYFIKTGQWPGIETDVMDNFYNALRQNPQQTLTNFMQLQQAPKKLLPQKMPTASVLQTGLELLLNEDLRLLLSTLQIPVCFMFGRLDAIVPYSVYKYMAEHYRGFRYHLFRHSAHIPFASEKEIFGELIQEIVV